ncbi:type II toxin-antitoxin system HicA family toxin [Filimonas effusa]|uniref:Type II toxin-antitoxin system HicA family toxin n=1 Tax=Filimonas effusa TaxID=2508721 RepID=A0A4Q1D126_9BACT|nr:type II toxin-antitoxin system HicA family toxin [Filimonas effusa]
MKARDVIKIVEQSGWYFERQQGSHKVFKHPTRSGIVVIPDHGKKDVPVGTLNSILKQAGLK